MIEQRLYVVLPETLFVPETGETIPMSCGRLFAQAIHVGSKLKIKHRVDSELRMTTIVLKVPGSKELEDVLAKVKKSGIPWETFLDDNKEVYGTDACLMTGIAAMCSRKKGKSVFFGIDSWKCTRE